MPRMTCYYILIALLLAGLPACTPKTPDQEKQIRPGKPPVAVEIAEVSSTTITDGIEVIGSLAPKFQSEIKSEYAGIVTEVFVNEWVQVAKGAPLAQLDTREIRVMLQKAEAGLGAARAGLLQAEVAFTRAEREYQRFSKMKEAGLVTQQALDEAKSAREAASAAIEAGKAQIAVAEKDIWHTQTRLEKATILAPMDGVIAMRGVNVGDLAGEMGSPKLMFLIVDNRVMNLTVNVPSTHMSHLRLGQTLLFQSDAVAGKSFRGKVMFINPSLSESDRSVRVVAEVANTDGLLKGGMFVKGLIEAGRREGVMQVPRAAVFNWDVSSGKGSLFVAHGDAAQLRQVSLGNQLGDQVEVLAGLALGEKVVTRGSFNLKDGDLLQIASTKGD